MKAYLVIQTTNGYACAPYSGSIPENFVENMAVATEIKSYSYSSDTVLAALTAYFEPKQDKDPAPVAPSIPGELA